MGWASTGEVLDVRRTQIALQLIDEFSGRPPLSRPRVVLQSSRSGTWVDEDVRPAVTSTGVYTWPGLERRVLAGGLPARDYRVLVEARFYRPLYPLATTPGVAFSVQPNNPDNPPTSASSPVPLYLLPASNYPYENHVRVLRGRVVDAAGAPVPDALVALGSTERVLSDDLGGFALPLRWPARGATGLLIDADDRGTRSGDILVDLPSDLGKNHDISIT